VFSANISRRTREGNIREVVTALPNGYDENSLSIQNSRIVSTSSQYCLRSGVVAAYCKTMARPWHLHGQMPERIGVTYP